MKICSYFFLEKKEFPTDNICDQHVIYSQHYNDHIDINYFISVDDFFRIKKNGSDVLLYIEKDKTLGLLCAHRGNCFIRGINLPLAQDDTSYYFFWIYIKKESRNKKILKKIMNSFFFNHKAINSASVLVSPRNKIMIKICAKMGFVFSKKYYFFSILDKSLLVEINYQSKQLLFHLNLRNDMNYPVI